MMSRSVRDVSRITDYQKTVDTATPCVSLWL